MDRRADVFASGVVFWELLAGKPLHDGKNEGERLRSILFGTYRPLRELRPDIPEALERLLERALARAPQDRYSSAGAMGDALDALGIAASASEVGSWIQGVAREYLKQRASLLSVEESSSTLRTLPAPPKSIPPAFVPGNETTLPDRTERIAPERMEFFGSSSAPSPRRRLSLGVALGITTIGVVFGLFLGVFVVAPRLVAASPVPSSTCAPAGPEAQR